MKLSSQIKIISRCIPEERIISERQKPILEKWVFFSKGLNEFPPGKIHSSQENLHLKNPHGAIISAFDGEKNFLGTILPDTKTDELFAILRNLTAKGKRVLRIDLIQQGASPANKQLAIKALYVLKELNLLPKTRFHGRQKIGGIFYHMEKGKLFQMGMTDKNKFDQTNFKK